MNLDKFNKVDLVSFLIISGVAAMSDRVTGNIGAIIVFPGIAIRTGTVDTLWTIEAVLRQV
jgi:hypothetical protein